MRRCRFSWTVPALLGCLLLLLLPAPPLLAQGLELRMQKVVAKFVETTGSTVMGVGSWISRKSFDPDTSDFDMRFVVGEGGTEAEQLARWQQARTQMATLIKQEFGKDAGSILSRTNLYAPNQLMRGVENPADAMGRFQSLQTVPNLGHTGPVTPATTAKYAEGLYGSGSQTYVQAYERGAGRLFYSNNGTCVTGLSEMAHMGEEFAKYTAAGTASTAGQWAEHALNEMRAGQGDKVAKYLERLERDLAKSYSMTGMPTSAALQKELLAFRNELKSTGELLKKSPWKLNDVAGDVARLVARGKAEAAIVSGFENAGPLRRAYLRVMLDGVAAKNKLGELIGKVMEKTPGRVNAENTMNFIVFAIGTGAASESLGRGDDAFEGLSNVCGALNPLKMIGPALLAEVMAEIIIQARAGGYDMAAGFQGAWDLMEGLYSAWGRADVDPDPRLKLTLADMVANYQYENKLEARVMTHAIRASTRGLGTANAQSDDGVARAVFAKCWPVIRDAWRWERDRLASEYLKLGSEVVHMPLAIYYTPVEPQAGQQIACEVRSADGRLTERLQRMREIVRLLYGKGSGLGVNYYWEPDGVSVGERSWYRGYTFDKPGTYPVKIRMEVAPFTGHTRTEPRVMLRREVPALVDIVVGEATRVAATSPVPSPGSARPTVNVIREAIGEFGFMTGVNILESPLDEGNGLPFAMKMTQRRQIVLHPVGVTPPPAQRVLLDPQGEHAKWYADLNPTYGVPSGVPYHFAVSLAASFADKVRRFEPVNQHTCHITFVEPRLQVVVSHWDPAGKKTTQQFDTAVFQLDRTFVTDERYVIDAYVVYDFTVTQSNPLKPTWESKQNRREKLATISLQVF